MAETEDDLSLNIIRVTHIKENIKSDSKVSKRSVTSPLSVEVGLIEEFFIFGGARHLLGTSRDKAIVISTILPHRSPLNPTEVLSKLFLNTFYQNVLTRLSQELIFVQLQYVIKI